MIHIECLIISLILMLIPIAGVIHAISTGQFQGINRQTRNIKNPLIRKVLADCCFFVL